MSSSKQGGAEEATEEPWAGFNSGSPLYSDMVIDYHYIPSPQSWDSLSPLWNFGEDSVNQSSMTGKTYGLSVKDSPQSHSCNSESYGSPADHGTGRKPSPLYSVERISQEENDDLGLPGRVFRSRLPEWSPNVQYYPSQEYPLLNHALRYNIQGMLALPLFESGGCCIGVLELITTSMKINYAKEIDLVCKALETVELRSSEKFHLPCTQNVLRCNEKQQSDLMEILEVLTIASETYGLPLAQTWTLCSPCPLSVRDGSLDPSNCNSRSYASKVCMSSYNFAFYVVEAHMWGFKEACIEHHVVEGQGIIGRAFSSPNLFFCRDITQLCKADYPLVHYARMFGLQSCFTVPLGTPGIANDIYILEFFLPPHLADFESQKKLLTLLFRTIHQSLKNLQILSHKGFGEEGDVEIINFPSGEKHVLDLENCEISCNIRCGHGHNQTRQTGKEILEPPEQEKKLSAHLLDAGRMTHKGEENIPVNTIPQKEAKVTLETLQQLRGMSLQNISGSSRKRNKTKTFSHTITSFGHRWPLCRQPVGRFQSQEPTEEELEPWEAENVIQDSTKLLPASEFSFLFNQEESISNNPSMLDTSRKL